VVTAVGVEQMRAAVAAVPDPELPVLTIEDLGVLRGVELDGAGRVVVTITPTYSGCPAMAAIEADIVTALDRVGIRDVSVRKVLSPPWTTDWLSESGRRKLAELGVAPPTGVVPSTSTLVALSVRCPRCGSLRTRELSRFSSTACMALYRCEECLEPFDHFKVH